MATVTLTNDTFEQVVTDNIEKFVPCTKTDATLNVHATVALDRANMKFVRRFTAVEQLAVERGVHVGTATLAELDELWDDVKRNGG